MIITTELYVYVIRVMSEVVATNMLWNRDRLNIYVY